MSFLSGEAVELPPSLAASAPPRKTKLGEKEELVVWGKGGEVFYARKRFSICRGAEKKKSATQGDNRVIKLRGGLGWGLRMRWGCERSSRIVFYL